MARILYTSIVDVLKGSIAGTTFQNNFSGQIAHSKVNHVRAATSYQQFYTNKLGEYSEYWNSIPALIKAVINSYAAGYSHLDYWGVTKKLTGYNYFMMTAMYNWIINAAGRIMHRNHSHLPHRSQIRNFISPTIISICIGTQQILSLVIIC